MPQFFETQLAHIRETLLRMSALTGKSLAMAMRALTERDTALADEVRAADSEIDQLEIVVDDLVVTYMATHGPTAKDSRLMLVASKISNDLERIADQATTIARRTRKLNQEPPLIDLTDLVAMAEKTQTLLDEVITAFVEGRFELAEAVIPQDEEIDQLNKGVSAKLILLMKENPQNVQRAVHLLTVSRALERAADHVQNIAEEVFYLYSGRDIRHS